YDALCRHLQLERERQLEALIPDSARQIIDLNERDGIQSCLDLVRKVYRIEEDDVNLRSALQHPKEHRIAAFDQLRKHYRLRREFSEVVLRGVDDFLKRADEGEVRKIRTLGFRL
ncbi:MAG: DUF3410 domain-containing protein, partial [Ketobacteraceae bacterium]|nr:DUF3410 domain-containing protein [Ketobacteraceae bacterium]